MKKILSIAIASALISGAMVSTASAEVTGNIGATSNYIWRGVSQTGNASAVSGGIDYEAEIGFYAGTWSSTGPAAGEVDFYTGFKNSVGDFSYDVGYIAYLYPESDNLNFGEVYVGLGFDFFSLKYSTLANSTWGGEFADDSYLEAAVEFEVSEGLTLGAHVGTYMWDDDTYDYIDYNVSLTKAFELGDASFMLTSSDLDDGNPLSGTKDEPKLVVSWTTGFDL